MKTPFPTTVRALLDHPRWDGWISDRLGNDLFLSDPDRASRCHDAAEHGEDGSTNAEVIEDWREFGQMLRDDAAREVWRMDGEEADAAEAALETAWEALQADIDRAEAWHEANGSLHS